MIKVGSDFSGVGAFDQALRKLNLDYKTVFACDMDKYARQTYIHNYGEPEYYPENVYDREIPEKPLDIYMTSPPCQAFSLAGKRKGEDDKRGVLFYNSHEFILKNKPRYFIFENVKGLLSDAKGRTFQIWLDMLGGKSVNGNPVIFPREDATPYHVYHQVLNAKHYGVPQNRERVFIIGIRDDSDNDFTFPKPFHLEKRLKDVLQKDISEKYYLTDKMKNYLETRKDNFNNGKISYKTGEDIAFCINKSSGSLDISDNIITEDYCDLEKYYLSDKAINSIILNEDNLQKSKVDPEIANALQTPGHACGIYKGITAISVKSATKKGYEEAKEGDSINFSVPNSETRRGRVGKEVAQTLDTACNQGVISKIDNWYKEENKEKEINDIIQTGHTNMRGDRIYKTGISPTLPAENPRVSTITNNHKIRRLTPREAFRLMDFPDSFTWPVSDTQAYKQAGNSIVVNVLSEILKKLFN